MIFKKKASKKKAAKNKSNEVDAKLEVLLDIYKAGGIIGASNLEKLRKAGLV